MMSSNCASGNCRYLRIKGFPMELQITKHCKYLIDISIKMMESMYAYLSTNKAAIRPDKIGSKGCGTTSNIHINSETSDCR